MQQDVRVTLKEIAPIKRTKSSDIGRIIEGEGQRILDAIPNDHGVVTLDVCGEQWSTLQLAQQLLKWQSDGRDYSFLIGGADGLSVDCQRRADQTWSLSRLTLPHPLARVVVCEALYRAWSVNKNHPYHRE